MHAEEQSEEVRLMADSSSGEKITVNLDIGEEVFYGSYHTRFYTVDGQTAYCLEPSKPWPSSGAYEAQRLEAGSLRKSLYYLYGGPGYKAYVEKYGYFGFSGKMVKADEYCMSHCIAAYFYLENNNAFIGLSDEQIRGLKQKAANIRSLPEPPEYFNAFIFNTSGSRQVMGGTGKALTGSVEIYKKSGSRNGQTAVPVILWKEQYSACLNREKIRLLTALRQTGTGMEGQTTYGSESMKSRNLKARRDMFWIMKKRTLLWKIIRCLRIPVRTKLTIIRQN